MRREREPASQDPETIGYTFHFQISSNGGRQACSIKVEAHNVHEATKFFRQNWPMIEVMARDRLLNRSCDDWTIKLAILAQTCEAGCLPGGQDNALHPVSALR